MSDKPCPICTLWHRPRCVQAPHRWPLGPLSTLAVRDARPGHGRVIDIARVLGVSGEAIRNAAEFGLSDRQADVWAIRCGYHPAMVWPEWIDAGLTVRDRQFIDSGWRHAWLHTESEVVPCPVQNVA